MKIAVIPARGGSKRIPRKNIRPFLGRPIIAYSIDAARETELFDRIVVSTDDAEIAEVARALGAEAPFVRPTEISDDRTGTAVVVKHALETLGPGIEAACCIYATAPFVRATDISTGWNAILEGDASFAFSVTSFPFPIQRALRRLEHGVALFEPAHAETRSQDLEPAFHDAGQFYWGTTSAWLEERPLFAAHSSPVVLPRWRVQDIDDEEDWARAEHLFRAIEMAGE